MQPRRLSTAFAAAASALALASAWHSGRHMWHRLTGGRTAYSRSSADERRHAHELSSVLLASGRDPVAQ